MDTSHSGTPLESSSIDPVDDFTNELLELDLDTPLHTKPIQQNAELTQPADEFVEVESQVSRCSVSNGAESYQAGESENEDNTNGHRSLAGKINLDNPDASDSDNSSVHDTEDACSVHSETSTLAYSQEPFETFRNKALELALQVVWPDADPKDVAVERLEGGGFNRITGLLRTQPDSDQIVSEYILRSPRFEDVNIERDAAALHFVLQRTAIEAPSIEYKDFTKDNALGSPYMIQQRLAGNSAFEAYTDLTHEQKCKLATELGKAVRKMISTHSDIAGTVVVSAGNHSSQDHFSVDPLKMAGPDGKYDHKIDEECLRPYFASPPVVPIDELLVVLFKKRQEEIKLQYPGNPAMHREWDEMMHMTAELEERGFFDDQGYSLVHMDFEPRNILVNADANPDESIVSGILDWDSALFGPTYAVCKPPVWIWAWSDNEDGEEDERIANDQPATEENRQLKALFEAAAGTEYAKVAYQPAYRLARRLFRFAVEGMWRAHYLDEHEEMIKEWNGIKNSASARRPRVSVLDWT